MIEPPYIRWRHPPGCSDADFCWINRWCRWQCQADPYEETDAMTCEQPLRWYFVMGDDLNYARIAAARSPSEAASIWQRENGFGEEHLPDYVGELPDMPSAPRGWKLDHLRADNGLGTIEEH